MITLKDLIKAAGYNPQSYSGRGMYGKSCLGATVPDVQSFCMELGYAIGTNNADDECDWVGIPDDIRWDNLGKEEYIVYFPDVPYEE